MLGNGDGGGCAATRCHETDKSQDHPRQETNASGFERTLPANALMCKSLVTAKASLR